MKKRGILLFAVFLFILMTSYAIYEESAYSGTVKHGEIIEISDRNFQFRIDHVSSKVVVDIDSSGVIIENGECRIKDNFDICVKNISFSHRNLTTYLDIYQAEVEIYLVKPSLDVAHTIDKSSILIDEEATAEFSVENTADVAAKDFSATIALPDSVAVTQTEGCKKSFGSIAFREDIHPKQVKKCTYKLKGLFGDEFELTANASYFDGIETVSADSDPISVKVYNYSLKLGSELNKSRFGIDEIFNITINAENINDQYELTVTAFKIKIPSSVLIIKKPKDMTRNNRVLSWSGNLIPKEKKSFVAELQARRTGNYTVAAEASYKISRFLRGTDYKSQIEVSCDCPYIYREISPEAYAPGQKILLRAFLINPDNSGSFSNLKLNYVTSVPELQGFSTTYTEIKPKEIIKIFDSSFNAPELGETYHFNISAVYKHKNQEIFVEKENIVIKIPEQDMGKEDVQGEEDVQERIEEVLEEAIPETGEETEESQQQETAKEEVPVITLEKKKRGQLNTYIMIIVIAVIIYMVVVSIVFKREDRVTSDSTASKKRRSISEILQLDLLKKEKTKIESNKPESAWKEDESYRELKKQIDKLGITPEGQKPKRGFWFFRKK